MGEFICYGLLVAALLGLHLACNVIVVRKHGWRGLMPPPPATYIMLRHLLRGIIHRRR